MTFDSRVRLPARMSFLTVVQRAPGASLAETLSSSLSPIRFYLFRIAFIKRDGAFRKRGTLRVEAQSRNLPAKFAAASAALLQHGTRRPSNKPSPAGLCETSILP